MNLAKDILERTEFNLIVFIKKFMHITVNQNIT